VRIEALRGERAEAQRLDQLAKYNAEKAELLREGAELESMLVGFTQAKSKIESRLESMNRLSFGVFNADQVPHKTVARGLHWALETRLSIPSPYRDHDFKKRHREPIDQIFARLMDRAEPTNDEVADSQPKPEVIDEPTDEKAKASGDE
jgi:hypothetical protein